MINATLLIQVVNFWVVYWLLRTFLFKPTVRVIEQEMSEKVALITSVDQQKKSIEIQEKERQRYVFMSQEYFTQHRPDVGYYDMPLFVSPRTDESSLEISKDESARLVVDVYKTLEEKIKHVH